MTYPSQKQPINILKRLFLSADKGSLSCVLIGQNLISLILRGFFKLNKFANAFSHSVTSFRFGKQDCVRHPGENDGQMTMEYHGSPW